MRTFPFVALLAVSISPLAAVAQPAGPIPPLLRGPVLTEEDGSPVKGVHLARAELQAVIHGTLAQATMTLTFANTEARVLGGELAFPLPEGATVTGYGLEINGQMVDGVAVERQQARVIYEKELHKRVDPGLVELASGNVFRTRLYPVPAKGVRSIKVQYVTNVAAGKDGASVSLPMGWGKDVDACSIRIDAPDATAAPAFPARQLQDIRFVSAEHGFSAQGQLRDAPDELTVALPGLAAQAVSIEKRMRASATVEDLDVQAKGGDDARAFQNFEHYFVVNDTPPAATAEPRSVHRVAVLWDAGLTRLRADKGRELNLLNLLLKKWPDAKADLVVFRNTSEPTVSFDLSSADQRGQLIETLSKVTYDGATDLGHLTVPTGCDTVLLFTDGMAGIGPRTTHLSGAPVYSISDDEQANHALLRQTARDTGGVYLNLKRLSNDDAAALVGQEPYSLVSVDAKSEEVAELYPPAGTAVSGRFTLAGKLLAPQATITLNYGFGKHVTHSQTFTLKAEAATVGDLIPRFWAQQKVTELSLAPGLHDAELEQLGKQFNLVTANTSLLVLETVEQYVQYRVVPPKTQPEVYAQFMTKIEQNRVQQKQTREEKLTQVVAWWNERVKWWEAEHKYPANLHVSAEVAADTPLTGGGGGGGGGGLFGAERSAASAAPAGLAAPAGPQPGQGQGQGQANAAALRPEAARPTPVMPASPTTPAPTGIIQRQEMGQARGEVRRDADQLGQRALSSDVLPGLAAKAQPEAPSEAPSAEGTTVEIKPWDPNTPYLAAMKAVPAERAYEVFLKQRENFAKSPAFYLDCADYLGRAGQHDTAVRVLTDVAALQVADARLLRVAAHRLEQIGEEALAIDLFEKVLKMRPEEPQSHRDLALALSSRADRDTELPETDPKRQSGQIASDYSRSVELLNQVIVGNWDRFQEIELPCLMEANRIIARIQRLKAASQIGDVVISLDPRLIKNLDCDIRVVMTWDADNTDIDLWVTEPSSEKCFYGHNRTVIGGLLSKDFTDGYGPEEYCLRKMMPGKYLIQSNYYGSRQQELTGPCTVAATVFIDFGRPTERKQCLTLRLVDVKEVVNIGTVELGQAAPKLERSAGMQSDARP